MRTRRKPISHKGKSEKAKKGKRETGDIHHVHLLSVIIIRSPTNLSLSRGWPDAPTERSREGSLSKSGLAARQKTGSTGETETECKAKDSQPNMRLPCASKGQMDVEYRRAKSCPSQDADEIMRMSVSVCVCVCVCVWCSGAGGKYIFKIRISLSRPRLLSSSSNVFGLTAFLKFGIKIRCELAIANPSNGAFPLKV